MKQLYRFRIKTEPTVPSALPRQFVTETTAFIDSSKPMENDEAYTDFLGGITEIIKKYASQLTADTPIFDSTDSTPGVSAC